MDAGDRILRSLRNLSVAVIHPLDTDGLNLVQQLQRIGCAVKPIWPYQGDSLPVVDIVIFWVDHVNPGKSIINNTDNQTTYIAVIDSESPTLLKRVVDPNIHGFILRPIRNIGILAVITKARFDHKYINRLNNRIAKLDQNLRSRRIIERGTKQLSLKMNITEENAYGLLRTEAMNKQISVAEMAESILNIDGIINKLTIKNKSARD